ncbi:MAG TPA: antitoxin Xre/MbcA/ParS toxin-binding domain-containing protein [Vicinamibacteria bacterium]|nr:antitoxin Xre/MbcA/ParS toxin-binding domain-containing protein [Vicinamibacteria bacterium]
MRLAGRAAERPEPGRVLSRAFLRAADKLGLAQKDQARVLGVSAASISRLAASSRAIDPEGKEGELAVLFLRLFRSLDALTGGDEPKGRLWLHSDNHHLGGVPAELIATVQGLVRVVEYLDAVRGRL